jgi:hypothetical protein
LVKRFGFDPVNLVFDGFDFLLSGGGNPILHGRTVLLSRAEYRCGEDHDHSNSC